MMAVNRRRLLGMALMVIGLHHLPAISQSAPDLLAEVSRRMASPPVLRGDFEQAKTIKGFKKPLLSHGTFVMARGRGVQWLTVQPFPSTVIVTRDKLLTLGEGGARQQVDVRQEPGLRAVNDMLTALLAGDIKALSERFKAEGALQGAQGWRLTLTPRDAGLAGFIASIELEGDQHVNVAFLHEASGDSSRIKFSNHTASPLTALEAERFAR